MNKLSFDVETAKEQLTQIFRDRISAQGSVYNVLNVDLEDISFSGLEEKIANQDQLIADLKADLKSAKTDGQNWFNDVQPQLTQIPQAAINYASLWNNTIPMVLEELAKPEPDRDRLEQLFQGLYNSAMAQVGSLSDLMKIIKSTRDEAATDANNFSQNHSSFQQLEDLDKENLAAARTTLAKINAMIAQYNQQIEVDTIKAEKDLAIASNAMKYGGKFGKPGKILGLTIGLIFIVSATMAIDDLLAAVDARLQEAQEQGEYDLEMTSLTTQLISLEAASAALAALVAEFDDLIASLQGTIDGWDADAKVLATIIDDLQGDAPISGILSQFDLGETQAEWDDLRVFATKWQTMEVSPAASNDIILNPPAAKTSAV